MNWKEQDRKLRDRSRWFWGPRSVKSTPEYEVLALNMGPHKEPTVYVRKRLSLRDVARGRMHTNPWRKLAT